MILSYLISDVCWPPRFLNTLEGKELLATTTYDDALLIERLDPARKSDPVWNRDPKRVLVAIVRDLDVVPDDPDPVDLAVALLRPSLGLGSMWVGMYYPPDWPANDASATGRKIHDVNMISKPE